MWGRLVVNYVANHNKCAPNDIATTTCKFEQNNSISSPTLNSRGQITVRVLARGM